MLDQFRPVEDRRAALEWYIDRRRKKGFKVVSQTDITAELYKPPQFPEFLRKEQTIFVNVDEHAVVWVRRVHY